MVKHIVFWKLRDDVSGAARDEALQRIKKGFEALPGKIPGLLKAEIGFGYTEGPDAVQLVFYSEFESRAALAGYETHAEHLALVPMVRELRIERRVGDYDI